MAKDYYAILGVQKNATEDEIKKAFRRLAHEHHPDKGGDQQKFKDLNEAYQVIGNKEKRTKYDQFGSAAFENGGMGGGNPGAGFEGFNINMDDLGDFGDILGNMFGMGGGRGRGPARGRDIETDLLIEFLDAVNGVKKSIKLFKHDACDICKGSGAEPGANMETCKTCGGRGQVVQNVRTMFGTMQSAVVCSDCSGKGSKPSKICKHCSGSGVERKQKEMSIDVPPGIADGETLKVAGEGEHPGAGGKPGDLYIHIRVKSHPVFEREQSDIRSTANVAFSTLALGGEVEIETVDGKGSLKIPDGTEPGTVFKIRGKGFPFLRSSGRGDHLVTVQPIVPHKPNKEQKKALEELRKNGL
jgi:molecular chaperone DnaJ